MRNTKNLVCNTHKYAHNTEKLYAKKRKHRRLDTKLERAIFDWKFNETNYSDRSA